MKKIFAFAFGFMVVAMLVPALAYAAEAPPDYGGDAASSTANATEADDSSTEVAEGENASKISSEIVDEGGVVEGVAADGSAITISKTIVEADDEGYYDITLGVQVEELPRDSSTAVVVVMDVSNTMNDDEEGRAPGADGFTRSRLQNAQEAANEFIRQYCSGDNLSADRMFGLVTFNTNAQWAAGLNLQNVSSESAAALQNGVNAIVAPSTPSGDRFTNMEAGLRLAYNALDEVDAVYKYVIFLTDGFPTTYINRSIAGNEDSSSAITGFNPYEDGRYVATQVGEDGYFADAVLGLPCTYGTSYSDKAALRAEEVADEMKMGDAASGKAGVNIFSVGIDIGSQTIQSYVDRATGAYSIVDRTSDRYVVGSATDPQAYRDWLANRIAGGPNFASGYRAYADGNDLVGLQAAFAQILADIQAVTGFPFSETVVTDPMGDYIEFQHFYDGSGLPADSLTGDFHPLDSGEVAANTSSFDTAAKTINWNLKQSTYELTEAEDGSRLYAFELRYRVRPMTELADFPFGMVLPTNDDAVFAYEMTDEQGVSEGSLVFPNPSVRAFVLDPIDPEEPVVPEDPGDPADPEDPAEPTTPVEFNPSQKTGPYASSNSLSLAQTGDGTARVVAAVLIAMTLAVLVAAAAFAIDGRRKNSRR